MKAKSESGVVIVFVALGLTVFLAMAGLALDVGVMRYQRRRAQSAADSAAIAGAAELAFPAADDVTAAAQADASKNGFTNGSNNVTVTVNTPPEYGAFAGQSGYVEAIVSLVEPTFFMKVIGVNTVSVAARAVATLQNGQSCVYALDPNASQTFLASGDSSVTINCGVVDDSDNQTNAAQITGNSDFTSPSIHVTGNAEVSGNSDFNSSVVSGAIPASNPLAGLEPPTPGACTSSNTGVKYTGQSSVTISSGTYCDGLTVEGNSSVTFQAGTYLIVGGGLTITGNSSMTATGVTFYDTFNSTYAYGPVNVSGNSNTNFSAPTSGPLEGILFFQDPNVPNPTSSADTSTVTGNSTVTFDGVLYFPTTALIFSGDSTSSGFTEIVADKVTISGSSTTNISNNAPAGESPIRDAVLVE